MNFGEKFRTEHSSLSGSMSKSELDTYAEKASGQRQDEQKERQEVPKLC